MSFQEKCSNTSLSGRPPLGAKVRVAALSIWSHSSAIAPCHPNVLVIMFFLLLCTVHVSYPPYIVYSIKVFFIILLV